MFNTFSEQGYLIIEHFIDAPTITRLKTQAQQIILNQSHDMQLSIFKTREQEKSVDRHFLESGDCVRCFFEEEAIDASGKLIVPMMRAINKIGHALHEQDPIFKAFSNQSSIKTLLSTLQFESCQLLQSMYIYKQPEIGGEVLPHQDATYLQTIPQKVLGLWFALEDATIENGCLYAEPGGHLQPLKRSFVRSNDKVELIELDQTPWRIDAFIPLEVPAGSLIVLHDHLPHMSYPNRSQHSRQAYTLHVADRTAQFQEHNWLKRSTPFPIL